MLVGRTKCTSKYIYIYIYIYIKLYIYIYRRTAHPVIVIIREHKEYIGDLLLSYHYYRDYITYICINKRSAIG